MWGLALARVRLDWRRSLATVLAVMFAVTSFVVLASTTHTQRVEVLQTADSAYRSSYDVLVRPAGAQSALELETGRVRPNFLSDTYGGISLQQWQQIEQLPGVEIAAPIAMVGLIWAPVTVPVDLAGEVADEGTQLFRIATTAQSRGGFSVPSQAAYLYVTDSELRPGEYDSMNFPAETVAGAVAYPCRAPQPEGKDQSVASPLDPAARYYGYCVSRQNPDAAFEGGLQVSLPVMIAAIDPEAEAALVGLDATVASGRYLTGDDTLGFRPASEQGAPKPRKDSPVAPSLLAATAPEVDYGLEVTVDELSPDTAKELLDMKFRTDQANLVDAAVPIRTISSGPLPLADLYARLVDTTRPQAQQGPDFTDELWTLSLMRPAAVAFEPGGDLVATASEPWLRPYYNHGWNTGWDPVPGSVGDSAYREVQVLDSEKVVHFGVLAFEVVGTFDPTRTVVGSPLSQVPLETYRAASVTAADPATEQALGGSEFLPNLNPADYLMAQPTVLIPLNALGIVSPTYLPRTDLTQPATDVAAPISAVRVRVADVTGWDEVSQERVRLVAQQIHDSTGLAVDITMGSALAHQPVTLTQIDDRPDLHLSELWSVKGVVTTIIEQIDRKSALLFGLILLSCGLTIATIANASAQAQRTDLGVLAAVGFRPSRIRGLLLTQQAILGGVAGTIGALVSWPIALAAGVTFDPGRALPAIPVALALMVLASLPSALATARTLTLDLLHPPVRSGRHSLPVHNTLMMGLTAMTRRPLRLVRACLSIALAVAALAMLLAIAWAFQGAVVGNLLGEAVALQVRAADLVAGAILAVLGMVCVAMTLSFGAMEDAPDWAVLAATGWPPGHVTRAILTQGAFVGTAGAVLGGAAALVLTSWVTGVSPAAVAAPIVIVSAAIAVASTLAAAIPAAGLRRASIAAILAGDS